MTYYLEIMQRNPPRRLEPDYDRRLASLTVDEAAAARSRRSRRNRPSGAD